MYYQSICTEFDSLGGWWFGRAGGGGGGGGGGSAAKCHAWNCLSYRYIAMSLCYTPGRGKIVPRK